ncbi:MAG TPA: iron chelate uptake ABC transporter family permease subunit [Gemmataceae bacterium]|nr:iron chelate uptake ABC transporter family permease subunit [Gemmataceae bacterium]
MVIDPALRTVLLGTAALGFVSGCLGTFAVLRRQSLLGDAVSHAALPGVVLAYLMFGKWTLVLLLGAASSGLLAMLIVTGVTRTSRIPFDTALAGALAVFFGAGLVLKSWIGGSGTAGIDRYLFGQAATLLMQDVWVIAGAGAIALGILVAFWKEFKLLTFDREFAAGQGVPVGLLDALLTGLMVLGIVIGLESVGVVLMSALVVAPAAAARQWTNRLGVMAVLAGFFGAVAGAAGSVLSHELSDPAKKISVPTGPTIVLCATVLVGISFAWRVAPVMRWRRGVATTQTPAAP